MVNKTFIISLGGSIIAPETGIDIKFLKKFKDFILAKTKLGYRFIIVAGGGVIAREYIQAANKITLTKSEDNDWTGIAATRLNAQFLRSLFGNRAYSEIIIDPNIKINSKKNIIIGAGYKPGWSTDYASVLLAVNNNIKTVINLSNIDYVYDKNPIKYNDAQPLTKLRWVEFKRIIGSKWSPGLNSPFDPIASKLAARKGLGVVIMNGRRINNLDNYISDRKFKGTSIV